MILAIASLRLDGGTQPRAELDRSTVETYAIAMRAGDTFPRPTVFYDGSDYWLADGFHRVSAATDVGATDIDVAILQGTRRDAVLFAVGANAEHGLRRSNADKRRAIETLLRDEEWSQRSDSWIAQHCKVDHKTVARVRVDLGIPKSCTVEGKDGRTIDVSAIGTAKNGAGSRDTGLFSAATEPPRAVSPDTRGAREALPDFASGLAYVQRVTRDLRAAQHHEDCLAAHDAYEELWARKDEIFALANVPGDPLASLEQLFVLADARDDAHRGALFDALYAANECLRRGKALLDRELDAIEPWMRDAAYALAALPKELRGALYEEQIAVLEGMPADEAKARRESRVRAYCATEAA